MKRIADLATFAAGQARYTFDAAADALHTGNRATHRSGVEQEAVAGVVAQRAARDVDGEQAAIGGNARQSRQRLCKRPTCRRRAEVPAYRMCKHDAMKLAPAVVTLPRRTLERSVERRTCHRGQRTLQAAQQDDVAAIFSGSDAWYCKEIDAGRTSALTLAEILEQILEAGDRIATRTDDRQVARSHRGIVGQRDELIAPHRVDARGHAVRDLHFARLASRAVSIGSIESLDDD